MTPSLGTVDIDLPRLLETRMLIQSNSGGGKSFCLRRVLEQTAPHVQQLVIDPEGEFATLRERHDYIVCAPRGADAVANPNTAAALAVALWQARTSAVLDIYELKAHERVLFVRRFLEALVNAPRAVWNPALVVIDEAHMFAPQVDKAESLGAVIDLATRGRKRGLALLAATQRLSKLHKDVAAELLNKAIGRTGLDVDVRRAADELGMNIKEATETLRNLDPGEFFVYGPALSRIVERTKIGPVQTTHPETGKRALVAPPPPSLKVLAQLAKIEGLQRDAEAETKTVAELSGEVTKLRRALTLAEQKAGQSPLRGKWVPEDEVARRVAEATAARPPASMPEKTRRAVAAAIAALQAIETNPAPEVSTPRGSSPAPAPRHPAAPPGPTSSGVSAPQQRILDAVAWFEAIGVPDPRRSPLGAVAGASPKSSGFEKNLSTLRTAGLLDYPDRGRVILTDAGRAAANKPAIQPSEDALHEAVCRMVSAPQAVLLRILIGVRGAPMERDALARLANVSALSSGFEKNISTLRSFELIDYPQRGSVMATDILFPKGKR